MTEWNDWNPFPLEIGSSSCCALEPEQSCHSEVANDFRCLRETRKFGNEKQGTRSLHQHGKIHVTRTMQSNKSDLI